MKLSKNNKVFILIPSILMILLFLSLLMGDLNIFSRLLYHPIIAILVLVLIVIGVFRFLK